MNTLKNQKPALRRTVAVLGCSIAVLLGLRSAHAASQVWDGGSLSDPLWSTALNWLGDPVPPGDTVTTTSTDVATFNAPIANTWGDSALNPILFDLDRNIGGINFAGSAGNYFLGSTGGNVLKLSSGGMIQILRTLTATNAIETINAPLEIQGVSGAYFLSNDSANGSGEGAGTLRIGGGITTVGGDSQLVLTGTNTNANTVSGVLADGTAPLSLRKTGTGNWTLTAANTYTGSTNIQGGSLTLAFGGVAANILPSSNALTFQAGTLRLTGAGTQTLNGWAVENDSDNRIILEANETLTLGTASFIGSGSVFNFHLAAGGANGATVGTGVVQITGQTAGAVIRPTYTVTDAGGFGLATVNGANQVVRLTTTELLPASGASSANDYRLDNHVGGGVAGSSTLTITGSQSAQSITVDTTARAGVLTLNPGAVLSSDTWNFGGAGSNSWRITGSAAGAGLQSATPGGPLTLDNYNAGTVQIEAPILANGTSGLRLHGNGRVVLSAANTYTGDTVISGGVLEVPSGGSINAPGNDIYVTSNSEQATLAITGGSVSTGIAHISAGGVVTMSGGSWNSPLLRVGEFGTGVLNITGGTVSVSTFGVGIGVNDGSIGTVTISGGGTLSSPGVQIGNFVFKAGGTLTLASDGVLLTGGLTLPTVKGAVGIFNYGSGGPAPRFTATSITGGLGSQASPVASLVNINHTGYGVLPVLKTGFGVTKQGSGRTIIAGPCTYVGTTRIDGGELLFTDAAPLTALAQFGFGKVTVAPGASFGYAATRDVVLKLYNGLTIGGAGTVISVSVGSQLGTAAIVLSNVSPLPAITPTGSVILNIYGITGVTPMAGTNNYQLIKNAAGSGPFYPSPTLGMVLNNSNFTVGTPFATSIPGDIKAPITRATPIPTAYWMGGLSLAPNTWAASDGSTASNWAETPGGAAQPLTPGPSANITLTGTPASMILGANMGIASMTIADTVNGLHLDFDGFGLTVGSGGLTMNAGVPASTIVPNITLGTGQTWRNDSANPLTMSGFIQGSGVTWTKAGAGEILLLGDQPFTGLTSVNEGTLLVSGTLSGSVISVTGAGATFGGTGLMGPITVNGGAILQAGDDITPFGTLRFDDNPVTLLDGSILRLTLGAAGAHSSFFRALGTWTFDSDQAFTLAYSPGATAGFYDNIIVGLSGTETGMDTIAAWRITNGDVAGTFSYDNAGNIDLNIATIPEPASTAFLLGGLAMLAARRRSRATRVSRADRNRRFSHKGTKVANQRRTPVCATFVPLCLRVRKISFTFRITRRGGRRRTG